MQVFTNNDEEGEKVSVKVLPKSGGVGGEIKQSGFWIEGYWEKQKQWKADVECNDKERNGRLDSNKKKQYHKDEM